MSVISMYISYFVSCGIHACAVMHVLCTCVCRADVVLILSCAAALLPWLEGMTTRETTPSPPALQGLHRACNQLFTMAVLSTCSILQLLEILSQLAQDRRGTGEWEKEEGPWLPWLEKHLHLLCESADTEPAPPTTVRAPLPLCLALEPHPLHWGLLLRASHLVLCVEQGS